jgi:hypothetical protein
MQEILVAIGENIALGTPLPSHIRALINAKRRERMSDPDEIRNSFNFGPMRGQMPGDFEGASGGALRDESY